ncbi:MAG TPA: AAA family ATPase [Solirubrobacteraceae bacterium]|nr:AAA family ATPase [Solirubrobacteraceae bacterium]
MESFAAVSLRVASPEFVGRTQQLAQLTELARAAAGGDPRFVLIGGESGVGKSRLVAEFAGRAEREGARVLAGDCVDLGGGELPYAPLVGALRSVSTAELADILGRGIRELAPLLPQLEGEETSLGASSLAQGRLFELLLALLGGLGGEHPLVLIVEDAHWADPSTRDFLSFLIRNRRRERLVVAVTYRTDELHRRHPLRAFVAQADRSRTVTRLTLERFSRHELAEQLAGILGHAPAPALVEELFRRAEGNPFFTEELIAAGGGSADGSLPDDVRDALMLRIESLSPAAQSVLRVAAAAGARVRHRLLVAAAPLDGDALVAGLREAVAHHVLVQDAGDTYRFRHALLREAIADDLLPGERGPLHAALGRALAEDPGLSVSGRGVAAELAAHWSAAHDLPAAFAASAQAGVEAERMAAFAEANAHFERAAELWDAVAPERRADSPSRVELLRRAAEAIHLTGDSDRATALARSALALVDAEREPLTAVGLHERIGRFLWISGLSRDALAELGTAIAMMPADAPAADRARVLGAQGHLLMLLGRGAEARERCELGLALAQEAGARAEECRILNTLGPAQRMTGSPEEAIATARRAQRLAEELGDPEELTRSYINLAELLDEAGRMREAIDVSRAGVAMARREGVPGVLPMLIAELAWRLIRQGGWHEADEILPEAVEAGTSWGVGRSSALSVQAQLQALRGEPQAAERTLQDAEREQRQAVGSMWTGPLAAARADAALWDGRPEAARAVVDAELARREPTDDSAATYLAPLIAAGARAEAELAGRARTMRASAEEAEAVSRAVAVCDVGRDLITSHMSPEPLLFVATASAETERAAGSASADTWAGLAARWDEHGNVFQAVYARWRQAELTLAAGGSRAEIPLVLAAAHATAAMLGAEPLRRELEDLARRARIDLAVGEAAMGPGSGAGTVPASAATDATAAERIGLTARELDVLRLMAGGATNREIAAGLYISQKTVTVHVTRILSKLDARTRVEAAGLAQRLGLLEPDPASDAS